VKETNGRINNAQRHTLANLAVEVLSQKVQQAKDESGERIAEIREQIRRELGVDAIEAEIESMEAKIQILKKKKEELGFGQYKTIMDGSKAKMLLDQRTSSASEKVKLLEEKKTDAVSRIWTSTTMSEALSILEEARNI